MNFLPWDSNTETHVKLGVILSFNWFPPPQPDNLPPPFKGNPRAFVLPVPSRPMRPWQNPDHKRNWFPWKLLATRRGKKNQRKTIYSWFVLRTVSGVPERRDERAERKRRGIWEKGGRVGTYGMRGNKKRSGRVWSSFLSHDGHQARYLFKKRKENQERNTRLSAVQWGNHSTEGSWVITGASFEKPTLSLEKPGRLWLWPTYTFLTYSKPFIWTQTTTTTTVCKHVMCGWNFKEVLAFSITPPSQPGGAGWLLLPVRERACI